MFLLNLYGNGYNETGLDSDDNLDALLARHISEGWEEEPDRATKYIVTVTDGENGPVVATIMWLPVEGQEQPDLLVTLATGETRRYIYVPSEPVYSSRRVA